MVEKLNAGICWKSFSYNNPNHVNNLDDEGFTFLRICINLADFQQATPDNAYMKNIFNMQDGMWPWDSPDFPEITKRWWSAAVNDKVRNAFDYCKAHNKLPIVCFLHSEEQTSWIGRSPSEDKLPWLTLMTAEFAKYVKLNYNFSRCDMESWNEPNECMSPSVYAQVTSALSVGWRKVYPYSWVHGFSSNLREQKYLNDCLAIPIFVKSINCISPHILTREEWNQSLINSTYDKCFNRGLKVTYLEVSPMEDMDRLHMLIGKCSMYGILLWIRNSIIGQKEGIEWTDALIYNFDNPNTFDSTNKEVMDFITTFNKEHTVGVDMSVPIPPVVTEPWLSPLTKLTNDFRWGEFWSNNFGKPKVEPPKEYYPNIFKIAVELQKVRDIIKIPIVITSGYRTVEWNSSKSVEGASGSLHLTGKACDSKAIGMYAHEYFAYICRYTTLNHLGCYDIMGFAHAGLADKITVFK